MASISSRRREAFLEIFPPGKQWEAMADQIAALTAKLESLAGEEIQAPKWRAMMTAFEEIRNQHPKEYQ